MSSTRNKKEMKWAAAKASAGRLESIPEAPAGARETSAAGAGSRESAAAADPRAAELSELDQRLIRHLQGDLAVVERPFAQLAVALGLEEAAVLSRIRELVATGVIRRFGATLRHQRSGYNANAMVVWRVAPERLQEVGRILAAFREVSHCYQRPPAPGWPYNLFTMIHARSRQQCRRIAARMAAAAAVDDYELLFTTAELKKTTMAYFEEVDSGE